MICTLGGVLFFGRNTMADKEFKTLDEQIEILRSRGLIIEDEITAKKFLLCNNYYRISGYSLTLRSHDVFSSGVTFENIMDIYEFDHELRHILLKYLESIEVSVKSAFSYEFTKVYGGLGYLEPANFTDATKHTEIINKAEQQKKSRLPHEAFLKHFIYDLQQDIPLWAYVDLLTISDISFLYKIAPQSIKLEVAKDLGITKQGDRILEKSMHLLTIVRNLCAHGSRLYNRLFQQKPWLSKKDISLLIVKEDGTVDNAHLYGFILIMRKLLDNNAFGELKQELIALTEKHPFVCMRYYGFRDDWKTVL